MLKVQVKQKDDLQALIEFCSAPRTRQDLIDFAKKHCDDVMWMLDDCYPNEYNKMCDAVEEKFCMEMVTYDLNLSNVK